MYTQNYVLIILNLLIPWATLGELKESGEYESDTSVHDHEFDESYESNVDEKYTLEKSSKEVVVKVPPPLIEPIDNVFPNPLVLIPPFPYSPPFPSHKQEFMRFFDYFMNNDFNVDLHHVDHLFECLKEI